MQSIVRPAPPDTPLQAQPGDASLVRPAHLTAPSRPRSAPGPFTAADHNQPALSSRTPPPTQLSQESQERKRSPRSEGTLKSIYLLPLPISTCIPEEMGNSLRLGQHILPPVIHFLTLRKWPSHLSPRAHGVHLDSM